MTINIIYLVIIGLLVIFNMWQRFTIKFAAKRNLVMRIIWLTLAVAMGYLTYLNAKSMDTIIGGIFIITFFLTLFFWHPGLSEWGVLSSMRQIQSYYTFTRFETTQLDARLTQVNLYSGDVLLSSLKIKANENELDNFLSSHIKPHDEL